MGEGIGDCSTRHFWTPGRGLHRFFIYLWDPNQDAPVAAHISALTMLAEGLMMGQDYSYLEILRSLIRDDNRPE